MDAWGWRERGEYEITDTQSSVSAHMLLKYNSEETNIKGNRHSSWF